MERLTDKKEADAQRQAYEKRLKNGYPRNIPEERFLKLALYEDTGLSPETVSDLLERFSFFYRTVEGLDIVDPVHFGAFVDRVKRWQQAEKDGRMVVLPCKVGDTVFAAETNPVIPLVVVHVGVILDGKDGEDWESLDNFGKTVFLTREEAEAALKKEEASDEAD